MRKLARKIINKYKKEIGLEDWSIDVEICFNVITSIHFLTPQKTALLVINKAIATYQNLDLIIKQQILELKEKSKE